MSVARFQALADEMVKLGYLSNDATDTSKPIAEFNYNAPAGVNVVWRVDASDPGRQAAQAVINGWDWGDRRLRRIYDIYQDVGTLTAAQQNAVWADLTTGNPPRWALDAGRNAAAIAALHWSATNSGAAAAGVADAKKRMAAMYSQDNVSYLVHPPFDATIVIAGDEPIT